MLVFLIKNRHGSITVMLSIILIAALSLNSTLLEIARFRGIERLYKEIGENAAFSILAHYDRDLYENFGFLAVEQGIGSEDYLTYLKQNLTGLNSGMTMNGADLIGNVTDVDLQRIYPLSQEDVYVSQMMEFGAYRAPTSLVNNALNLEDALDELMENLEDALPIFEILKEATGLFEAYINVVISLSEYTFSLVDVQNAAEDYIGKLNSYNDAVAAVDAFIDGYEEPSSDGDIQDADVQKSKEEYENQLAELRKTAENHAKALQESIENLDKVLEEHLEKLEAYEESYDQFIGMNIEALLSAAKLKAGEMDSKEMGETAKNWIEMMEDNIEEGKGLFSQAKDMSRSFTRARIETAKEKLKEQAQKLRVSPENFEKLDVVQEVDPTAGVLLTVASSVLALMAALEEMFMGLLKTIETIVKGVEALVEASTLGICDPHMNHEISSDRKLGDMENPYGESDEAMVMAKLADSEKIAKSVNYNVSLLSPGMSEEAGILENALNNLMNAEGELREACSGLKASGSVFSLLAIIDTLRSLMELARAIGKFLGCLVDLINAFIGISIDQVLAICYQKLFAAVYATEMFSNRVTDMNSDNRLNGSDFFDEDDYQDSSQCFVQADTEYIFVGNGNEISNQTVTFFCMLMLRILGNVTAVLTDDDLMQVISEVAAVPVIGWIAVVVIVVVKLFLEAWYDMIFMIYAREDVEIIKLNGGYFALSGDGVDGFSEKVKKLIEEQTGVVVEADEDSPLFDPEDYVNGLLEWGYQDHLFLLILLFTSRKNICNRTATLIETQLRQKKAKDGAAYVFDLDEMATFIRVETKAEYKPLLPIPSIPGLNDTGIPIKTMHYSGY